MCLPKRLLVALLWLCGCGDSNTTVSSDGTGQQTAAAICTQRCAQEVAANCPNTPSDCESQCEQQIDGAQSGSCASAANAYAACTSNATYTCDSTGLPTTTSCTKELDSWASCINSGGDAAMLPAIDDAGQDAATVPDAASTGDTGTPDAGTPDTSDGGSFLSCEAAPTDIACDQCLKAQCCSALTGCTGECAALISCSLPCMNDNTCGTACALQHPGGVSGVTAIYNCQMSMCATQCTSQ